MNKAHPSTIGIAELFDAIEVESEHAFRLGGRRFRIHGDAPPDAKDTEEDSPRRAAPFVTRLANVLYRYVYSRPFDGTLADSTLADDTSFPEPEGVSEPDAESQRQAFQPDDELLTRLSAANTTRERWEHGWHVAQIHSNGQIQAQRGHLRRWVWPGQFLSQDGPGAKPRVGSKISLFYAKESTSLQPAFYYLFGETAEEQAHAFGIMRLYWNVNPEGAPALIGAVSRWLNRYQVPFRMKCAVALAEYERTDAAVLYLPKSMTRFVVELLPELYPEVRDHLAPDVPFFSRQLAPGLGLAEDPGTGESFGQHRCGLVAQAVWNGFLRQDVDTESRLAELRRLFSEHGVHLDHSHLNANSLEGYEFSEVIHERAA